MDAFTGKAFPRFGALAIGSVPRRIDRMPIDYLRKLQNLSFPVHVDDAYEIGCIEVLRAAELVTADITPALAVGDYRLAIVTGITMQGRSALELDKQGKPPG